MAKRIVLICPNQHEWWSALVFEPRDGDAVPTQPECPACGDFGEESPRPKRRSS